jgi:hypothetical protein
MKIGNIDYPIKKGKEINYILVPVGINIIGDLTERYRAAEVLLDGTRDVTLVLGKKDFLTWYECLQFCDSHNRSLGLMPPEIDMIRSASSMACRKSTISRQCGFCATRNVYNAGYCYSCEQPFDNKSNVVPNE